jgi:hypothetical protein
MGCRARSAGAHDVADEGGSLAGVLPTWTPTLAKASFWACAVPEDPEMIAAACRGLALGGGEPGHVADDRLGHVLFDEGPARSASSSPISPIITMARGCREPDRGERQGSRLHRSLTHHPSRGMRLSSAGSQRPTPRRGATAARNPEANSNRTVTRSPVNFERPDWCNISDAKVASPPNSSQPGGPRLQQPK